ncbi:MAG: hypothetical protein AAGB15_06465 [Pseudomonadota bacterium]
MKGVMKKIAVFGMLAALAACVGPTPYGPATERHGYKDQALEQNRYRVTFAGNTRTSRQTVENYLLYRAAELTVASGNDWFRVAEQDTEVKTRFRGFSTGFGRSGFGPFFYRSGFNYGFFGGIGTFNARPINRYEAFANILVFKGDKPAEDGKAYDARSVLQVLEPSIVRAETAGL